MEATAWHEQPPHLFAEPFSGSMIVKESGYLIPRECLYVIGFGDSEPVAGNGTARNRRVTAGIAPWGT